MRTLITLLFTLSTLVALSAQSNSWLGGSGYWHDATKWSFGTVPTAQQIVLIGNGEVVIQASHHAYSKRLQINTDAQLTIQNNSSLTIDGFNSSAPHGVATAGNLVVNGRLTVKNVSFGNGINNSGPGLFQINAGGQVLIRDVSSSCLWNNATVINAGQLQIRNTNTHGIQNYGLVNNTGTLSMQNVPNGIDCWIDGIFENSGSISINMANLGIILNGNSSCSNYADGSITISNVIDWDISVGISAAFDNFGAIDMTVGTRQYGIYNQGLFSNHEGGDIHIDATSDCGLLIYPSTADFSNDGLLTMGPNVDRSFANYGTFANTRCAELKTDAKWDNFSGATMENEGWWYHDASINSTNAGQVINDGVIEDYQGSFPAITNDEIIARPLTGSVQVGVTVPNALDLSVIDQYSIVGWYTTPQIRWMPQSAGKYSTQQNTWKPNVNAVGLSEVYVHIRHLSDECNDVIRVAIPGGVAPLQGPTSPNMFLGQQTATVLAGNNLTYPNPNKGAFTWETAQPLTGHLSLQLFDLTGRAVWQQQLETDGQRHFPITLDNQMASGTYLLTAWHNGARVGQERVVIAK